MQKRNPIKSVNIKDKSVEYYFPNWKAKHYIEINDVLNDADVTTPMILGVYRLDNSTCIEVEKNTQHDWFTFGKDIISPVTDRLIEKLHSCGVDRTFDEKYIDIRAPNFKYKDKIMSGPYVLNHMDLSSVNIFADDMLIDFEDAVMAPREYDYVYRFFDPYTLRDVSTFDDYCVRYNLDIEKSLYIQLYICEMIFHFVETLGYHRPSIPQTRVYYEYVNKRLFDRQ